MRFAVVHGCVCTANDDGSVPLNSKVVADNRLRSTSLPPGPVVVKLFNAEKLAEVLNASAETLERGIATAGLNEKILALFGIEV